MDAIFQMVFDPNVVYLALVIGFILVFFAVLVPGTGLVEVLAIAALLFASTGVYYLADEINYLAIGLLALGVIPFLIAVRKSGRMVYLAFALTALTLGSAYLFRSDQWWMPGLNLPLVILMSLLNAVLLWVVVNKSLEANLSLPRQELVQLIGKVGEAETDIHEAGTVQVASELWSARSAAPISAGARVRVVDREGFTLEVEDISVPAEIEKLA